jgi:acyl-coenzyme A thioesterase PaaI-like protein
LTSDRLISPATAPGEVAAFEFEPHNCFACGTLNTGGLRLTMHVEPGRSWTETTLDRRFEGWEGVAHGGILCAILDEVMAWALVGADNWGVTARMSVDFRKPVVIGRAIRAEGWATLARRRVVDTAARIVDAADGTVLAKAEGRYLAASEARKGELRKAYGFRLLPAGQSIGSDLQQDAGTPDTVDARDAGIPANAPR